MPTARSIRVILVGDHTGGAASGEIWQTGFSCVEGDAGGVFNGAIKEGLPTFDTAIIGEATENTNYRIDWAWKGTTKATQANQIAIADAAVTMWTAVRGTTTTNMRLTEVRTYAQDDYGKVIGGGNVFALKAPSAGTASASSQLPVQLAVVASLRTGARGPGGRGRMYWPLYATAASGGTVGTTTQSGLINAIKACFESVRGIGPLPAVVNAGPKTYSAIKTVEVGNLYDTQRRRINNLRETYTGVSVVYP